MAVLLIKILITIFIILNNSAFSCFLDIGRKCDTPIRKIKTMSERCSGSYYIESLIKANSENIESLDLTPFDSPFGVKHFSPWFGYEESYYGPARDYTFEGSDDVLFIIIFRDPYDWIRSIKKTCFLGPASHQLCSFFDFIRMPWGGLNTTYENEDLHKFIKIHPLVDLNPVNGQPFENIIKMRTEKIKNFLKIRDRANNYIVINYEHVRDNPQEFMLELAEIFNLNLKSEFDKITKVRGNENAQEYIPIKYPKIDSWDLHFINSQLDKKLEESIGYKIKNSLIEE